MPLYPPEAEIAEAVLGKRAKKWRGTAEHLESKHGLPKIDALMGGRFWPLVQKYFWERHGMRLPGSLDLSQSQGPIPRIPLGPVPPDRKENFHGESAFAADSRRPRDRKP